MWVSGMLVSGFWHAGFLLASQVLLSFFGHGSFPTMDERAMPSGIAYMLSRTVSIRRLLHHSSTQTHFLFRPGKIPNLYWKRCADNEKLGGAEKWGTSERRPRCLQCQNTCLWSPTVSSYSWHLSQAHTHSHVATTSYTCSVRGMVQVR